MKRPAFQFYPADWRKDAALRLCSLGARGLWWEMICLMHEATPYGHLVAAGRAIDALGLERLVGAPQKDVKRWLAELRESKVFSETEDGVIFSRRMVRDENERQEWGKRQRNHRDKQRYNPPDVTQMSRPSHANVTDSSRENHTLSSSSSSSSSSPSTPTYPSPSASDTPGLKTVDPPVAKQPRPGGSAEAKTGASWEAYSTAYQGRYGAPPTRNARANGLLAQLVDRLGAEEAPAVAAFFLRSNRQLYAAAMHPLDLLIRDAEALRTAWATDRHATESEARMGDKTQARGNVFEAVRQELKNAAR